MPAFLPSRVSRLSVRRHAVDVAAPPSVITWLGFGFGFGSGFGFGFGYLRFGFGFGFGSPKPNPNRHSTQPKASLVAKAVAGSCNAAALERARSANRLPRVGAPAATPAAWWVRGRGRGRVRVRLSLTLTLTRTRTRTSTLTLTLTLTRTLTRWAVGEEEGAGDGTDLESSTVVRAASPYPYA